MFTVNLYEPFSADYIVLCCKSVKEVAENLEYNGRTYDLELDEYRTTDSRHLYFNMNAKVDYKVDDLPF